MINHIFILCRMPQFKKNPESWTCVTFNLTLFTKRGSSNKSCMVHYQFELLVIGCVYKTFPTTFVLKNKMLGSKTLMFTYNLRPYWGCLYHFRSPQSILLLVGKICLWKSWVVHDVHYVVHWMSPLWAMSIHCNPTIPPPPPFKIILPSHDDRDYIVGR